MNKQENKLLPELRFPEFRNDDQWDTDLLGNIAGNVSTGKLDANAMVEDGRYRFYTCAKNYYLINEFAFDTEAILIAGNGAYLGYIHHYNGKFNAYQRTYVLSDFTENILFIKYFLERYLPSRIDREKKDGNTPYIVLGTLTDMVTYFPPKKNEQQKIASCLSSLDDVIAAHTDKLENLKQYKKGLLQNVFPQEGETVPKLRFKEFENDGEWEYLNGDLMFNTVTNKNHNSDLPILAVTQEQGAVPRDLINYNVVVTEKSLESYKVVEVGDFIISLRSFQGGIEYSGYRGICSPAYIILRKIESHTVNEFYKYYFKTDLYIRNLNKNLEGLRDGKMVSYSQFSEIMLPNPNPKEQQKIASLLSSVDDLIQAETDKITQLKAHKKGLLQGLFPKID